MSQTATYTRRCTRHDVYLCEGHRCGYCSYDPTLDPQQTHIEQLTKPIEVPKRT